MIITAISGGLYLFGEKGTTQKEILYSGVSTEFNVNAQDVKLELTKVLQKFGEDASFETANGGSDFFFTRPTSKTFYVFEIKDEHLEFAKQTPNLNEIIVELHKGHGPKAFKIFQQILAIGLLFIVVSGLWLSLSSPMLRNKSLLASSLGGAIFLTLALF